MESPRRFVQELCGDVEIGLGRDQADVAQVGRQQREPSLDIAAVAVPGQELVHRKCVSQVVHSWPALARCAANPSSTCHPQERADHLGVGTSAVAFVNEERRVAIRAMPELPTGVSVRGERE